MSSGAASVLHMNEPSGDVLKGEGYEGCKRHESQVSGLDRNLKAPELSVSSAGNVLSGRLGIGLVPGQGQLGCLGWRPLPCRTLGRRWGPCSQG